MDDWTERFLEGQERLSTGVRYYAPDGSPLTTLQWAEMFEDRSDLPHWVSYVRGGFPHQEIYVSTVWLGLDHSFGWGPPLVWETMAWPEDDPGNDMVCLRYPDYDHAWRGHLATVGALNTALEGHNWHAGQMRADRR